MNERNERNESSGLTRRQVIRATPAAIAGGALGGSLFVNRDVRAAGPPLKTILEPRYYPLQSFTPEIDIEGKLAVITGASRGMGRAMAEALTALGADVIGTSRDVSGVPDPPDFPLLDLDISDEASVLAFLDELTSHPLFLEHGQVDILVNNAGRLVVGQLAPLPPTTLEFYLSQRALGVRTLYGGHVHMTNVMLPLMPTRGYARILFTIDELCYQTGGANVVFSAVDAYVSSKRALLGYANSLAPFLAASGSDIRVSTLNPYFTSTGLADHPNPIYTQPVNEDGLSETDEVFNEGITQIRQELALGLPPSFAGNACAQLLRMIDPTPNVVVASPDEPFASMGQNQFLEGQILAENELSAIPFGSALAPPGHAGGG